MKKPEYLLELVSIFTSDTSLLKEVELAIDNPGQYVKNYSSLLQERGITKPIENLLWLALVNGLSIRKLLYELDWKDDPEELVNVTLNLTVNRPNYNSIKDTLSEIKPLLGDDIEEFLPIFNNSLEKEGVQLVWLDIDSDSYPLTIIDAKNLKVAQQLALKAGFGRIK